MKSIFIIIALIIAIAYCATDWNKVLNNVVSVGIKNALAEGTLRTLYPLDFNATQSRECCNKCNRKFVVNPSFYTDTNASSQLGGVLAQVYTTNQLLIGISAATGNDTTLFTQYPNGTFGGILVDASQAIADQISFILAVPVVPNITVIPVNNEGFFDSVVVNLQNNTVQVFADVSYTFARSRQVDFTCFYSSPEKLAFYVNPNNLPAGAGNASNITLTSLNSAGINVAVTNGTIYEQAARELLPNANIQTYPDLNSLYAALQNDSQVTILPALNISLLNPLSGAGNSTDGGAGGSNSSGSSNSTSSSNNVIVVQLNDLIFEYGTGVGFATLKATAAGAGNGSSSTNTTSAPGGGGASSSAPTSSAPTSAAPTTAAPTTAAPSSSSAATTAEPSSAVPTTESPSTSTAAARSLAKRKHKKGFFSFKE